MVARLAFLLAAGGLGLVSAQTITVGTNAKTTRSAPQGFFGYNDQSSEDVNREDPSLLAALSNVRAQVTRFPGGQNGNYWDWQLGLTISNYDTGITSTKNPYPRLLPSLQQQMALMHSTPIFMLNLLTDPECKPPAGGLCQYTPSSPNLNYQLQMLQAAAALGITVKYVELGNEYYVTGVNGYAQVYPDPVSPGDPPASTVYAKLATQWIAAIKKQFPQALVAAIAANSGNKFGTRSSTWNQGLFPALQGEDALVLHTYIRSSVPSGTTVFNDAAAEAMLGYPFSNWTSLENDIAKMPQNLPIWFTEFNLGDFSEPVYGTWAHGLEAATMAMLYLEDPRVVVMCKHDLVSNAPYAEIFSSTSAFLSSGGKFTQPANPPATTLWGRAASNMTLDEVARAAASASQTTELSFPGVPMLNGGGTSYPALYGWSFQSGSARRAVVLNLSSQSFTVDVSGLGLSGQAYDQISGAPFTYVTGGLSGSPSNLTQKTGTLAGKTCALTAYSITRIFTSAPSSRQPAKGRDRRRP
jgi:hypothetical protein